jgi:CSLREA domain-containing protein
LKIKKWLLRVVLMLPGAGLQIFSGEVGATIPGASEGGILYFVNTPNDTVVGGACANGQADCSLRGAIEAANSHPGEDGIELGLPAGSVIQLTQALPPITDSVSLFGSGPSLIPSSTLPVCKITASLPQTIALLPDSPAI